jgi:Fe-S-cluster containining protein
MPINNELSGKQNIFKCFMCGVCCREFRVVVNIEEGNHLAKGLGLDWNTFKEKYLEQYYVAPDRFLIRQTDGNCIFLDQINPRQAICLINDFKPASCREWQADTSKHECKTGLKQIWNLDISQDGEIKGVEADFSNFDLFINSID